MCTNLYGIPEGSAIRSDEFDALPLEKMDALYYLYIHMKPLIKNHKAFLDLFSSEFTGVSTMAEYRNQL